LSPYQLEIFSRLSTLILISKSRRFVCDIPGFKRNFGGVPHDDKTFSGEGRLGNINQDDFFAKTQDFSLKTFGVCSTIPTSSEAWDLHELAMCYEMDPYEESNI